MVGRLEARQNVLEKDWRGGFRRFWKTLFTTVAVSYLFSFPYHTSFMARMIQVLLRCGVQDIFRNCSSNCAERAATQHGTIFSEVGLSKYVLASGLFLLRPYFKRHLTARRCAKISSLPLQFIL